MKSLRVTRPIASFRAAHDPGRSRSEADIEPSLWVHGPTRRICAGHSPHATYLTGRPPVQSGDQTDGADLRSAIRDLHRTRLVSLIFG